MNLTDFLKRAPNAMACERIGFEPEILEHFDACVIEAAEGRPVAVVTDLSYRDYVENVLLKSLSLHGTEASYCLCVKSVESYADQIANSGVVTPDGLLVCLGDEELLTASGDAGRKAKTACCMAVLDALPSRGLFSDKDAESHLIVKSLYFDLVRIREMSPGDWRERTAALEILSEAFRMEAHVAEALGRRSGALVHAALDEIEPVRATRAGEDSAMELCEGYAWLAAARAALGHDSSLDFVMNYDAACPQRMPASVYSHAAVLARLADTFVEVESLEIDPDDCAAHQLPAEIYKRSVRQMLIEDEVAPTWANEAIASLETRVAVRSRVHVLLNSWDELCSRIRVRGEMLHAAVSEKGGRAEEELFDIWSHAARIAPPDTFIRMMETLRLLEGALFE